ncbi:MAG TPA: hypothetical protein DCX07_15415, partial [Phycisphaerales bacterium]|nr:hypothetical protein [Phycisphaerales bacterium]
GTPEWAAISPQRYAGGGNRKHMVAPDNEKYREIVEHAVAKFADRVEDWELWNESNIRHFWVGTPQEFADFCKMAIPIIRKGDPTARIIIGGMAGTTVSAVDPFAVAMVENEITKQADLFAFHCYAPAGLWDVGYGLIEGHLFSLGCGMEIYANEQGFGWREGEKWLRQGEFSPDIQARLYDIGMGRLMANGVAKVTDFNAGGDDNTLGIIDENGQPRPAYAIFADYLNLTGRGARRLDVSLTAPDGGPLRGVYVAASTHDDGAVTLIANPADVPALHPAKDTANRTPDAAVPVRIRLPLSRAAEYTVSADEGGKSRPAEIKVHRQGNAAWAEVALALTGRTVVRLAPK